VQGRAGYVLGRQPVRGLRQFGLDQRRGVGTAHGAQRLGLAPEPVQGVFVVLQMVVDHLDRGGPATRRTAEVHPPHATLAEPADQPVPACLRRISSIKRLHWSRLS
jgi:hypothetical protein